MGTSSYSDLIIHLQYLCHEVLETQFLQFVQLLEANVTPQPTYQGNIRLSKYDLFENLNLDDTIEQFMLAVDGERTILEIADYLNIPFKRVEEYVRKFNAKGLIEFP